ncbi:hypothetical protein LJK88_50170 [Paenibacillus sp. P26]|nr:hypothetical protein LJK88_50170 [Paenibacillus sp. P26]
MKDYTKFIRSKKVWAVLVLIAFVYLNNSSLLAGPPGDGPQLLAHRGLAQTFPMEGLRNDTCTAERIYEPEHPFLENTLASMEAAFQAGADIVEFDVHITRDEQFAVFHDWTLDCRTNAKGVTRDYTMAELKSFDIGYGYTADHGKTYPFRGKGIGQMPSLTEVLTRFPDKAFLIDVKSRDPREGELLASYLTRLSEQRPQPACGIRGGRADRGAEGKASRHAGHVQSDDQRSPPSVCRHRVDGLYSGGLPAYRAAYPGEDRPVAVGLAQ